jgi:hypothetical protein
MTPRYPVKNSATVVWINTATHRCTAMDEDVAYPLETRNQGRDASNPVPAFSMLAGKPDQSDVDAHNLRARSLRRMLASAIGAWLAFALLVYFARLATNGA